MKLKVSVSILMVMIIVLCAAAFAKPLSDEALGINESVYTAAESMKELQNAGIAVQRYNDTFIVAKQLYDAQSALERSGGTADYTLVKEKLIELTGLKQKAFRTLDELRALGTAMNGTSGISDMAPVLMLYQEAADAFSGERYEESIKKIDETYNKISELEALETKVKAFYDATTRTFVNFVKREWKEIVSVAVGIAVFILLTHRKIMAWLIIRKINELELRKQALTELIGRTQKDYFGDGIIDEGTYHTRIQRYGELMRDLNRQIPVLKEQLAKKKMRHHFAGKLQKDIMTEAQEKEVRSAFSDLEVTNAPVKILHKHKKTGKMFWLRVIRSVMSFTANFYRKLTNFVIAPFKAGLSTAVKIFGYVKKIIKGFAVSGRKLHEKKKPKHSGKSKKKHIFEAEAQKRKMVRGVGHTSIAERIWGIASHALLKSQNFPSSLHDWWVQPKLLNNSWKILGVKRKATRANEVSAHATTSMSGGGRFPFDKQDIAAFGSAARGSMRNIIGLDRKYKILNATDNSAVPALNSDKMVIDNEKIRPNLNLVEHAYVLRKYIMDAVTSGQKHAEIKQSLISKGWPKNTVESYLEHVTGSVKGYAGKNDTVEQVPEKSYEAELQRIEEKLKRLG